jgi:hypothetical protein
VSEGIWSCVDYLDIIGHLGWVVKGVGDIPSKILSGVIYVGTTDIWINIILCTSKNDLEWC